MNFTHERNPLAFACRHLLASLTNRQNKSIAREDTIASLGQKVQELSRTINDLKEAARVELAGKAAMAAARGEARVDLASCAAGATDLDSVSAEFADYMVAALGHGNKTTLPPLDRPHDEPPLEVVFERAR